MRVLVRGIISFGIIEAFLIFFVCINLLTLILYMVDKQRARKGQWRIKESVLVFFTLALGGVGALLGMLLFRHKTRKIKFRIVGFIGMLIVTVAMIHVVHGLTLDRMIRYVEVEVEIAGWPQELAGYRIAFMTDMHTIPDERMAEVVARLNESEIDLLLLGGDFSMRNQHYRGTIREIAKTQTSDGILGVEGNHDHYQRLFAAKQAYGIVPLDNSGVKIRDGFYVAGIHDLWNRNPDIAKAVAGAAAEDFVLLVSHNPDVVMKQSTEGVDFVLAGHTHGGQITFFGWPFYLLRGSIGDYGLTFSYGFAEAPDGTMMFTSSGVGDLYTIPRIFARPEVVIFTMN